ncbi:hypothetical protein [Prosthecobacter dejongeii]|uniref:Uncharacterized protein n=1 Tax=Prosthecobacter dejongeii TaxID=48465 RepID=A0A7W7YN68_9BACT|nr:hypothetical protein [Prosthecobacter dejongeii]MBB5039268.1 hypothetical protein [Prosthecobacter dejongeii]
MSLPPTDLGSAAALGIVAIATNNVLGPTLKVIGEDLKRVYEVGRDKIILVADRKNNSQKDQKRANIRIAKEVFESGSYTTDEISAEYFGGILASCRSETGQDDSALPLLNIIKGLSTYQLHLHYAIYCTLNERLLKEGKFLNVAMESQLSSKEIVFAAQHIFGINLNPTRDLPILNEVGLVGLYKTGVEPIPGGKMVPFVSIRPTTLGVMVYCVAHNKFEDWNAFSSLTLGRFPDIEVPPISFDSIQGLKNFVTATQKNVD